MKIENIKGRMVFDSRGNPTVEAEVLLDSGVRGRAMVPSGASTGKREALELRDGGQEYLGKGVNRAIENLEQMIAPRLRGIDIREFGEIEYRITSVDDSGNKAQIGANATLAASMAVARTGATACRLPLFIYLRDVAKCPTRHDSYIFPKPLMNVINGGAHASNGLDFQEFMIVPHRSPRFSENLRIGVETFHHLKEILKEKGHATNVGDEGGFAPQIQDYKEALDFIAMAIEKGGYRLGEDVSLALDVAASEFYQGGEYLLNGEKRSAYDMIQLYLELSKSYPLYSIEDGLAEDDFENWTLLNQNLGQKIKVIGDDLFVTNKKILLEGIEKNWANSILIKPNQIGTLSETFDTMFHAFHRKMDCVMSHRSGETEDSFIADLAVATSCGHIKTGSASRSDRMAKYNQLLRIEEYLTR